MDATARECTFGVRADADLKALADNLSADRDVREYADGSIHAVDPVGFGVAFRVTQTEKAIAPEQEVNVPGRATRINKRGDLYEHASPSRSLISST